MVLGAPVGSPSVGSIVIFILLVLGNYFKTEGIYLVGVSLGIIGGLMIYTWEGYLVLLSLVLSLGYPLVVDLDNPLGSIH